MIKKLYKLFTFTVLLLVNFACINGYSDTKYGAGISESKELCRYVDIEQLPDLVKLDVPYIQQKKNYCGPASLAMVLQYMGEDVTQEEIGEDIVEKYGTSPEQLKERAAEYGYNLSVVSCGFNNLLSLLDNDKPIITRVLNDTMDGGHYIVVTGYNTETETMYINDPEKPARKSVSFKWFVNAWDIDNLSVEENSYNLMMIVSKKD